jgi:hypothetical protein
MAMSEERMAILRMIEAGTISAEEGARLLAAMGESSDDDVPTQAVAATASSGRALQIRVTDLSTNRQKVNINIPASLARLAMRFIPKNSDFQIETIEAALDAGVNERIMEVVDSEHNTRVEIVVV